MGEVAGGAGRRAGVGAGAEPLDAALGPGAGQRVEQHPAGGGGRGALDGLQQPGVVAGQGGAPAAVRAARRVAVQALDGVQEDPQQQEAAGVLSGGEAREGLAAALGVAEVAHLLGGRHGGGRGVHRTAARRRASAMCRMRRVRSAQ
ncbi:hypothetical protein [Streptomyces sp. SBT349]|uniref:hypothetical protein n=1 Tax=Streptomyces sp. SBT349 TaxID=1580539 RepID=UPI00066C0F9E|nr:hypothetical protein [Streptomyces sp. SBT349]